MTPRERRAAGLGLTGLGLSASEIALILHVSPRTVRRWRSTTRDAG
ncbi:MULTISPECIES: helix-turn-helix domain-containing protein [unclassified Streptomyces]